MNKEKNLKISPLSLHVQRHFHLLAFFVVFVLSFFLSGIHMSFFLSFLVRFSPETNYFVPVSISFILIEYSLYICHFSEFFKILVFRFHSKPVA